MNKKCPICNRKVTKKDDHLFADFDGMKRTHRKCYDAFLFALKNRHTKIHDGCLCDNCMELRFKVWKLS